MTVFSFKFPSARAMDDGKIVDYSGKIFHSPTTICISGTTGSGKTTLLYNILRHRNDVFTTPASKIVYCYSEWQDIFDEMEKNLPVEFIEGLPTIGDLEDMTKDRKHIVLILDDLMHDVARSKHIEDVFTRGSHHKNLTLIYLTQNLYCQGKNARTQSLNTHYLLLLRNPRDVSQIATLGRQTGLGSALVEAYKDSTSKPYGYLLLDLSPHSRETFQMQTDIIPGQEPIVYVPTE